MDVQIYPISDEDIFMAWSPPKPTKARVNGYAIKWSKDGEEEDTLVLGKVNAHLFSNLMPGQSISASVCAFPDVNLFIREKYAGPCSSREEATLAGGDGGQYFEGIFFKTVNYYLLRIFVHST